jgi:hypothetical protein
MNQLPAYLQKLRPVGEKTLAGLGSDQPPRLSIKDNRFTLIDGAGNSRMVGSMDNGTPQQPGVGLYLDVNIFDANEHISKQYRPKDEGFDADNPTPPACFSDNGLAPSASAQQPQHSDCATCPMNVIGSAISKQSGARMKACRDIKKMAVLVPGIDNVIFQFVLTPGSFKEWRQFDKSMKGHGVDIAFVTTRLFFTGQGTLGFRPVQMIDEATATKLDLLQKAGAADFAVGRDDKPRQLAAPAPVQQIAPAAEQWIVQVQPASEKPKRGRPPKASDQSEMFSPPGPALNMQPDPFAKMYPPNPTNPFERRDDESSRLANIYPQTEVRTATPAQPAASQLSFGVDPNPLPPSDAMRKAIDDAMNLDIS